MVLLSIGFIFGWFWGMWTLHWYYKSVYKAFVDEMAGSYRDALEKMGKG